MSNKIRINRDSVSRIFWRQILRLDYLDQRAVSPEFLNKINDCERYRTQADYNTGSISDASAIQLYRIAAFFKPRTIAEVGTFIGKSTLALGLGASDFSSDVKIHTCDQSNSIDLDFASEQFEIFQYSKRSSTQMFEYLLESNIKVDLLNIDGRISQEDLRLLPELLDANSIITLDDFEGIEKGVVNALSILSTKFFGKWWLIYPNKTIGVDSSHDNIAVILNPSHFLITSQ